jgi:hypothetical protein
LKISVGRSALDGLPGDVLEGRPVLVLRLDALQKSSVAHHWLLLAHLLDELLVELPGLQHPLDRPALVELDSGRLGERLH